jgi:hypothetical protein
MTSSFSCFPIFYPVNKNLPLRSSSSLIFRDGARLSGERGRNSTEEIKGNGRRQPFFPFFIVKEKGKKIKFIPATISSQNLCTTLKRMCLWIRVFPRSPVPWTQGSELFRPTICAEGFFVL